MVESSGDHLTTHMCDMAQAAYHYSDQSDVLEPVHQPHSNIFMFPAKAPR